ncbi:uncharacterized protein LOC117663588 isoform X3 [Pantherophis guttatus]|uniref:Uncharacterized protein LOC117663588 isoform X3 n=1 Tax=Pantherophis guttatus TaxID=94885 RepID=A0ABM3ZB71_PANGU|nr:uncharacterized protein LOC117663588 isoform X3 [Pantherophis guttatus]
MGLRKKNKSPPVLSHEFVIQNHADAVSCLAMGLLLGLMFEVTSKYAIMFITVQYNVTYNIDDGSDPVHFYEYGPKDMATIFFYMLIAIILHAVIQEYILDKINRRLHLSKTKHSKFNESGQLAFFYLFSFVWGASILSAVRRIYNKSNFVMEGLPSFSYVAQQELQTVCNIITLHGFSINRIKNHLQPTTCITHLGALIDSVKGQVFLLHERQQDIRALVHRVLAQRQVTLLDLSQLLGKFISCISIVPWARRHSRQLQWFLLAAQWAGRITSHSMVMLPHKVRASLRCWTSGAIRNGCVFQGVCHTPGGFLRTGSLSARGPYYIQTPDGCN